MNKSAQKIIGRTLMISGLATSAASLYDYTQNTALIAEGDKRNQITQELKDAYGIEETCTAGFSQMPICFDTIDGIKDQEEKEKILEKYKAELKDELNKIQTDREANRRGVAELIGIEGGITCMALGVCLSSRKER